MATITATVRENLIGIYTGMFKKTPGADAVSEMVTMWEAGKNQKQIAAELAKKPAFAAEYPALQLASEFADEVVAWLAGEASSNGKSWATDWIIGKLNKGVSKADIIVEAVLALRVATNTADFGNAKANLNNKIEVGVYHAVTKDQKADSTTTIDGVTSSAASVTSAKGEVDATAAAASGQTFTLTANAASVEEGGDTVFALSLDKSPTSAVTINYVTTTGTAGTDDYSSTSSSVTFAAGQTTQFVNIRTTEDSAFEADETFSVTFSGTSLAATVTATGTIVNDDIDPTLVPRTLSLTIGNDNLVGNGGNDTFIADNVDVAGPVDANNLTVLDILNGGAGTDTLEINDATTNGLTTSLVGLQISNIETVNVRSVAATVIDTSTWSGVETLNSTLSTSANVTAARTTNVNIASTGGVTVAGGDDVTITSATTADVGVTTATVVGGNIDVTAADAITIGSAAAGGGGTSANIVARSTSLGTDNIAVYGGANVTVTAGGVASTGANGQITVGNAAAGAAASGNVVVNATGTVAGTTIGAITVVGGDTVTVNQTASNVVNTTQTLGSVTVTGDSGTTAVSVINAARATAAAAVQGVSVGGTVTITDFVAAAAATADTISTVTLANFGATTITSSALSTLNVTGGASLVLASDSLTLNNQSTTAGATTLTVNSAGGFMGAISGTRANATTTIAINSSAATTIGGLTSTGLTTLNFTGAGATTLSAHTAAALVDINVTGAGGVTVTGALLAGTDFDGGAGNDSITLGATTQGITMGGGDDIVTLTAALGADGLVDGGDGFDLVNVATTTGLTATLNTVTGFEALGMTAAGTYDMTGLTSLTAIATANAIAASGTDGTPGTDGTAGAAGAPGNPGNPGTNGGAAGAAASMDLDGLSNTNTVTISHNITSAGGAGGAGGFGGAGGAATAASGTDGGAGGAAGDGADGTDGATVLDLAALVDTAANEISITLNGVTLSANGGAGGAGGIGGAGGAGDGVGNGGAGGDAGDGGDGGDGATVINAGQFDNISIISNASVSGLITANILSSTAGAAGAAGAVGIGGTGTAPGANGAAGTAGTAGTAGNGMLVANNATITISGAADLNLGTIATLTANNNLIVNASALTGDLTLSTLGGNDIITGGSGDDVLDGGAGADNITGGDGADNITGAAGDDVLSGGNGADVFTGGAGVDTITTGAGADRVVLASASADRDVVTDFTVGAGNDTIQLTAINTTVNTAAAAAPVVTDDTTAAAVGGGAYALTMAGGITTATTDVIVLQGGIALTSGANGGDLSLTTAAGLNGTELLKALTTGAAADTYTGITAAANAAAYLVAYQGGNAYIYLATDTGDGAWTAADIVLVGTLQNVAVDGLVAGNYAVLA